MSASAIRICPAEFDALAGEADELFRLYIGALRPRMDYATGIVGRRIRLSYQALREWTERAARPGVKYLSHDKAKLQRMLARLQEIGLLRRMGRPGDMVFACPLAERDSVRPNQADTKSKQTRQPAKPKPRKASKHLSTAAENAEVATHPESGITNTPPNPPRGSQGVHPVPHACGAGDELDPQHHQVAEDAGSAMPQQPANGGEEAITPVPHAVGAGEKQDPQPHRATAQQPSEERHEQGGDGGEGPPAQLAERGAGALEWEEHLAWPVRVTAEQRAYLALVRREEGEALLQRVLDELRGAMAAVPGGIKDPWAYFHTLLRNAKEKGDAWETVYAEKIADARQKVAQLRAQQAAEDAAYQASLAPPGYPGEAALREITRRGRQR